ncbi:Delta(14)-sterol reductase [Nannizzia gypsea CBS 118893]|uniref:Delta(14)-sterol reductase n=1 Tax=Arthroderma gypseum (strain ATCC MYA-4604 / CBS 118893) TaxID=535722 RepID=E5R3V5_ARTGP|nr:Delta(14)-sterol reductase [Nannizzia gypsea CBS 118893]EFQ98015.1 Delta(14)-sterol reductase [Nannizzia gypsea CBS 118893]
MGKANGSKVASKAAQTPFEKHGYEFCGPPGATVLVLGLPILIYIFPFLCNDISGCPAPSLLSPSSFSLEKLKIEVGWPENGIRGFYSTEATLYVLGYYLLSLVLQVFLPGREPEGVVLACGSRHKYKFNSFSSALLMLLGCAVGTWIYGAEFPLWTFLWENHLQVVTANLIICVSLAVFVYLRSFTVPAPGQHNPTNRELAPGGQSGNIIYDYFIGRELNPRITLPIPFVSENSRTLDIKAFCEMRPGLLGWVIMNLSNIAHQYRINSGNVTSSILLITAFQAWYVFDALYMEPAILTTIDIILDGFGFMLSFGDLVWVPFIYSLQTRYLAMYPLQLSPINVALILGAQGVGYSIFRGANNQKNRFRTNPEDPRIKHIKYIETRSGSRLMTSGWWGMARHINYLGDWIMAWTYCLPTGMAGFAMVESLNPITGVMEKRAVQTEESRGWGMAITYFYVVYFGILLVHRERRDEDKCKRKYGEDWAKYTSKVKSRIIPGIY